MELKTTDFKVAVLQLEKKKKKPKVNVIWLQKEDDGK